MENVTELGWGWGISQGTPASRSNRKRGGSLQQHGFWFPWWKIMPVPRRWNGAAQLPQLCRLLPCSDPPCCLHCHRHLYPAFFQSVHSSSQTILLISRPHQEEPEDYRSPSWWKACLQLANVLSMIYVEEEGIFFIIFLFWFNSESTVECGDSGLASVGRSLVSQKLLWGIPESPKLSNLILS